MRKGNAMAKTGGNTDVPTARAFAILDYVAESVQPVTMADAALALGLAAPTAHRLAVQLEARGYLQRAIGSKRFVMGAKLLELGFKVIDSSMKEAPRHAILQSLADAIGEQCELGILSNNEIVYVDGVRTVRPAYLHCEPGRHAPVHCTSNGKLFLSRLPKALRHHLVHTLPLKRYTPNTITDPQELIRELDVIRKRGWAASNEEYITGVVGCAVPVLGPRKKMVAGLAITVPVARMAFEELPRNIPAMEAAAARLSALLTADH